MNSFFHCYFTQIHYLEQKKFHLESNGPSILVFGISDTVRVDRENGLPFWQTRRIVNLANPLFAATFPKIQSEKRNATKFSTLRPLTGLMGFLVNEETG